MHARAFLLGFALTLGLSLASSPASAARPQLPVTLSLQLNGELIRKAGEDGGGGQLLYGSTNIASVPVEMGQTYYVECQPDGGSIHLCTYSTDGGCSATPSDVNYGRLIQAGQIGDYFVTLDTNPRSAALSRIYATGDSTTAFTCPVWQVK